MTGTLNSEGQANNDFAPQTTNITFNYNPVSQTYTLTRADGAHAFGTANLQSLLGGPVPYAQYNKTITGGSEALLVSRFPSTSTGMLNWVGHGLYIRQVLNGSTYSTDGDGFYFGVPTPSGAVPHTGSAEYSVALVGVLTEQGGIPQLIMDANPGTLNVNFMNGTLALAGSVNGSYLGIGGASGFYNYSGNALMNSTGFSGSFTLAGTLGQWNGHFFGPDAQEFGATFRSNSGSTDYMGSLVGSSDNEFRGIEVDLLSPDHNMGLSGLRLESYQKVDPATGKTLTEGGGVWGGLNVGLVHYNPSGQVWDINSTFFHGSSDLSAAQSDSSYAVYGDVTVDGNGTDGLRLLKPGAGNPTIELTYTSLGIWEYGAATTPDYTIQRNYAVFGFTTKPDQMPTTGSASYSGIVAGVGSSTGGADDKYYSLGGTVALSVDFANAIWSGSIHAIGTDRNSSATRDFGSFDIVPGTVGGSEIQLQLTGLNFGSSTNVGTTFGQFFGDKAAEFGGGFHVDMSDTVRSGYQLNIDGVYLGKKD